MENVHRHTAPQQLPHDLLTAYAEDITRLDLRIEDLEAENDTLRARVVDQDADNRVLRELVSALLTRANDLLLLVREQQRRLYPRDDDDYTDVYTDDFIEAWIANRHDPTRDRSAA